jgi:hypothetical protein
MTSTEIEVSVPFTGASDAFRIQPSMHTPSPPDGQIAGGQLTFVVGTYGRDEEQVKREIERTLDQIEQQLGNLRANEAEFQRELPPLVRDWIERRRTKLLADQTPPENHWMLISIYSGPREFLYFGAAGSLRLLAPQTLVTRRLSCLPYVGCPC